MNDEDRMENAETATPNTDGPSPPTTTRPPSGLPRVNLTHSSRKITPMPRPYSTQRRKVEMSYFPLCVFAPSRLCVKISFLPCRADLSSRSFAKAEAWRRRVQPRLLCHGIEKASQTPSNPVKPFFNLDHDKMSAKLRNIVTIKPPKAPKRRSPSTRQWPLQVVVVFSETPKFHLIPLNSTWFHLVPLPALPIHAQILA
jgi:hypothetical protein